MKIILKTNGIRIEDLKDLKFNKAQETLSFTFMNKSYTVNIEDSDGSYIKVFDDDSIEIINKIAICFNGHFSTHGNNQIG